MIAFNFKTHIGLAAVLWLSMAANGELYLNPVMFLLGAILPDADHRRAPIGRVFPLWIWFQHRGFTHSFWFMVVGLAAGSIWNLWAGVSLAAGIFLHLMLDSCTPMGVKWFGQKKRRH